MNINLSDYAKTYDSLKLFKNPIVFLTIIIIIIVYGIIFGSLGSENSWTPYDCTALEELNNWQLVSIVAVVIRAVFLINLRRFIIQVFIWEN